MIEAARPAHDPFARLHKRPEAKPLDLSKEPLEPEADIILFIRDHNRDLADWQRDLLTIVDEEARYFLPQIETKIMNEGWASHWHHRIMTALELPQDIRLEFMVRHNQVICPHPGGLNPYHVGFMVWRDIEKRFGGEHSAGGEEEAVRGPRERARRVFPAPIPDRGAVPRARPVHLEAARRAPGGLARSPTRSTGTTSRVRC